MKWWSDLWLNEGFATFMQYYAVDKIFPQFLLWEQFCSDVLIPSLQLDALENSHPIKVKMSGLAVLKPVIGSFQLSDSLLCRDDNGIKG